MSAKKTHLYGFHKEHAKMTVFAGFEMPLWYEGIIPEHMAVRNAVGIFDVTHMGRSLVEGKEAEEFLNYVLPRDISKMEIKQGRYTVMLNERGGIVDDLTVFRLGEEKFLVVYNAANREKDYSWLVSHSEGFDVKITDISDSVVMLALQGPRAVDTLQNVAKDDISTVRRYWLEWTEVDDMKIMATRTGYTGEDGFEIYLWDTPLNESEKALKLWSLLLRSGEKFGIKPCGLGARDTLRLEAGMCLYGHDITEEITPFEARLDWVVDLTKKEFVGKEALLEQRAEGLRRVRVGFRVVGRGIPREGYRVFVGDEEIGHVTSGTFSPLLKQGIGMGYVRPEHSEEGTEVTIDIRGKRAKATISAMPFYDTTRYGWRRTIKP